MSGHSWVADVLSDLERYLEENGGSASTAALVFARHIATEELGLQDNGNRWPDCRRKPVVRHVKLVVDNVKG